MKQNYIDELKKKYDNFYNPDLILELLDNDILSKYFTCDDFLNKIDKFGELFLKDFYFLNNDYLVISSVFNNIDLLNLFSNNYDEALFYNIMKELLLENFLNNIKKYKEDFNCLNEFHEVNKVDSLSFDKRYLLFKRIFLKNLGMDCDILFYKKINNIDLFLEIIVL
ncbi:MAG: hypothetical protein R3Y13_02725 [bacterium]